MRSVRHLSRGASSCPQVMHRAHIAHMTAGIACTLGAFVCVNSAYSGPRGGGDDDGGNGDDEPPLRGPKKVGRCAPIKKRPTYVCLEGPEFYENIKKFMFWVESSAPIANSQEPYFGGKWVINHANCTFLKLPPPRNLLGLPRYVE